MSVALIVAQAGAAPAGNDTGVIVAVIGAVGLVLAAIITAVGQKTGKRIEAVEGRIDGLGREVAARIDTLTGRFEGSVERFEAAVDRLADRIDRLYGADPGSVKPGPAPTEFYGGSPGGLIEEDALQELARAARAAAMRLSSSGRVSEEDARVVSAMLEDVAAAEAEARRLADVSSLAGERRRRTKSRVEDEPAEPGGSAEEAPP
jgi:hypothetical protein